MTKMRGCRCISTVSEGVSDTNHYCEQFGLTNVTNYETKDLNAAEENNRVQQRFVIMMARKWVGNPRLRGTC